MTPEEQIKSIIADLFSFDTDIDSSRYNDPSSHINHVDSNRYSDSSLNTNMEHKTWIKRNHIVDLTSFESDDETISLNSPVSIHSIGAKVESRKQVVNINDKDHKHVVGVNCENRKHLSPHIHITIIDSEEEVEEEEEGEEGKSFFSHESVKKSSVEKVGSRDIEQYGLNNISCVEYETEHCSQDDDNHSTCNNWDEASDSGISTLTSFSTRTLSPYKQSKARAIVTLSPLKQAKTRPIVTMSPLKQANIDNGKFYISNNDAKTAFNTNLSEMSFNLNSSNKAIIEDIHYNQLVDLVARQSCIIVGSSSTSLPTLTSNPLSTNNKSSRPPLKVVSNAVMNVVPIDSVSNNKANNFSKNRSYKRKVCLNDNFITKIAIQKAKYNPVQNQINAMSILEKRKKTKQKKTSKTIIKFPFPKPNSKLNPPSKQTSMTPSSHHLCDEMDFCRDANTFINELNKSWEEKTINNNISISCNIDEKEDLFQATAPTEDFNNNNDALVIADASDSRVVQEKSCHTPLSNLEIRNSDTKNSERSFFNVMDEFFNE